MTQKQINDRETLQKLTSKTASCNSRCPITSGAEETETMITSLSEGSILGCTLTSM